MHLDSLGAVSHSGGKVTCRLSARPIPKDQAPIVWVQ